MNDHKTLYVDSRWRGAHGIGRYSTEVIRRLTVPHRVLELPGAPSSPGDALRRLPRAAARAVVYSPGYNAFIRSRHQVLTLHDLIHLDATGGAGAKYRAFYEAVIRPVVHRAGVVLTVSETSRVAVQGWLGDRVEVVNAGIGASEGFTAEGPSAPTERPFVMYVGNLRRHKNLGVVLRAMTHLDGVDLRLLVPENERPALRARVAALGLTARTTLLDGLTDADLATHYRAASVTLMPSLLEGFGLPPLESLMCGTPVIYWAGCAAVAETVGSAGIAVGDADDSHEWADAVARAVDLKTLADGFDSTRYDWDRTGAAVSSLLARVMAE